MPLDAAAYTAADPHALYRQRREAAAELWRGVSEGQFDILEWDCGTAACALGWLCRARTDGWRMAYDEDGEQYPAWRRKESFIAAAKYFGITHREALVCFSEDNPHGTDATPSTVAAHLLRLPYVGGEGV